MAVGDNPRSDAGMATDPERVEPMAHHKRFGPFRAGPALAQFRGLHPRLFTLKPFGFRAATPRLQESEMRPGIPSHAVLVCVPRLDEAQSGRTLGE